MDWADTPEQAAFRAEVRKFIDEGLPQYYKGVAAAGGDLGGEGGWQTDRFLGSPQAKAAALDWEKKVSERGWVAPHWPKEYGGAGMSSMEQFILKQELSRAEAPDPGSNGGVAQLGSTLLVHGTEEQKKKFLPKTLSGEYLWAQGYSEPGAGSDLASLQTRAVRDGDEFVINGQKLWTSAGHKSNWIYMLVRTDPDAPKHRGISFLMVDMKTPGIGVRPIISMGWHHATNETFYEDVRVPVDQVVGEINRGWYVGMTLLDFERSNISGAITQRRNLTDLINYLKSDKGVERSQGRAELTRDKIADRWIESEVMFNFSFRIASMQAAGVIPNYEASTSKIWNSELHQRVCNTGMKSFGLYANIWEREDGYTTLDARFTQDYVHSVVFTIFAGSNEIQRNIIATRGLGLPRG